MPNDPIKPSRNQMVHDMMQDMKGKPTDPVVILTYLIRDALKPHIEQEIGTGFGFGEGDIDVLIEGQVVRVVVKPMPEMTKSWHDRGER